MQRRSFLKAGGAIALGAGHRPASLVAISASTGSRHLIWPADITIEVKEQRYPVRWACRQKLNEDGSLTLRQTVGLGSEDETGGVPRGPE
jgi:hypothetical protein